MRQRRISIAVPDLNDPAARAHGQPTNEVRAALGRAAVDVGTADRGEGDERTDAVDSIANVLHWLHAQGADPETALQGALRHFAAEVETVERRAVRILGEAGIDARLHHSGGGIWVAEARSPTAPGRQVWITDSEGDQGGPYLIGAYPDPEGESWFEALSGACSEDELVERVRRALTEPA